MRRRPWSLILLAILHFLAPIGNIIFNALIVNRNVFDYLVYALSPEYLIRNWVIVVAPIIAGYSIYACKKWSFYVYLFSITALFVFSYTGYLSKAESISLFPIIAVYVVNIIVVSYFLIPAVRNIYFDRRMRWWEIQPRYKCNFKCTWSQVGRDTPVEGEVGNISENGLFVKSNEMPSDNSEIQIHLPTTSTQAQEGFRGEAIIHNRSDAVGFGVKFVHTKESKALAKEIVQDLEKKGMRISTLDGRPEDSFSYWLRTLLTTGKGLVPKKETSSTLKSKES